MASPFFFYLLTPLIFLHSLIFPNNLPSRVWYAISDRKLERDWAKMLQDSPKFHTPIPRFGSSDYHRTRTTHLFYSKRRPLFRWFEEKIREVFEPSIRAQQFLLPASYGH
jgi:hypothetical protein